MLAFELCVPNSLYGSFPLWPAGHGVHNFWKQFQMGIHQATEHLPHFALVHVWWALLLISSTAIAGAMHYLPKKMTVMLMFLKFGKTNFAHTHQAWKNIYILESYFVIVKKLANPKLGHGLLPFLVLSGFVWTIMKSNFFLFVFWILAVLWLPLTATKYDAGLCAHRDLPTGHFTESRRLQGQGNEIF